MNYEPRLRKRVAGVADPLCGAPTAAGAGALRVHGALAQGIARGEVWVRYIVIEGDSSDPRLVASTMKWIRTEFGRAAAKKQRFGTARLLRQDAARIGARALRLPSHEEFDQEQGLEDERETVQIAAFEKAYGGATERQGKRAAFRAYARWRVFPHLELPWPSRYSRSKA